jgi:hypothetical protein
MTAARALTSEISRGYKTKNLSPNHIATAPAYFPIFRNLAESFAESGSHYRSGSYDLRTTSVEVLFLESPHTRDFHCVVVDPTRGVPLHHTTGDPDRYYPRGLGPREALECNTRSMMACEKTVCVRYCFDAGDC